MKWNETHIRYRTLNVKKQYRGKNLGWYLLSNAWNDWKNQGKLFGWIRDTHYDWAVKHNFVKIQNYWTDKHIAMERDMKDYDNIL